MSLEDLKAQAEAEETQEVETDEVESQDESEPEEPETEEGSSEEDETPEEETEEESEDFELELDGEPEPGQHKPSPEEAILHKLTKQRKKRQEAETERDELRRELEEIKAQLRGGYSPKPQAKQEDDLQLPSFPQMEDQGIDYDRDKYDQAVKKWFVDVEKAKSNHSARDQQKREHEQRIEDMTRRAAERVSKFAAEHKYKPDYVANALTTATDEIDAATKIDGSFAYLMDCVGEGSEKAALYVGTNAAARESLKRLLAEDTSGGKAIAYMARLASKQPKLRNAISKAPEPDQPLRGDGSSKSARKLQEEYDKASSKSDLAAMRAAKRKAEELGVNLK